jgi:Protein of unknown function (DUF998)
MRQWTDRESFSLSGTSTFSELRKHENDNPTGEARRDGGDLYKAGKRREARMDRSTNMINPGQKTTHYEPTSRIAGYFSLVSVAASLVLLIVLYFLEPEFNPPHLISEYQLGRFGYLMSVAFFCLGAGSLFLARALWIDLRTKGDRFVGCWLILIGIAYIGAGIFAPDPTSMVESRLHGLFGLIVIFSSPIVFTLLSRNLIHNKRWSEAEPLLKRVTILAWLGLLLFYGSIIIFYGLAHGSNTTVVGWTNRFMIAAYSAWLMTTARQVIKLNRPYSQA